MFKDVLHFNKHFLCVLYVWRLDFAISPFANPVTFFEIYFSYHFTEV